MNFEKKVTQRLLRNFGQGLYKMIANFFGTQPIFNPPQYMWDLIDDANGIYKPFNLTPNDTINLNDDSNATKKFQIFNVEGNTNVNDDKSTLHSPKKVE
jgi:hypothetical protein